MAARMKMFTMIYFLSFSAFSTAFPGREFTCPPGYVLDAVHGYCKLYNLPIRAVCTSCQDTGVPGPVSLIIEISIVASTAAALVLLLWYCKRKLQVTVTLMTDTGHTGETEMLQSDHHNTPTKAGVQEETDELKRAVQEEDPNNVTETVTNNCRVGGMWC
ncbi:uncharacterized protein LOC144879075 [Branchiostoma floridae x Branchiostoma japonicum]